jgi:hypothetical protein
MEVIINGHNTLIGIQYQRNINAIKQPQHLRIFGSCKLKKFYYKAKKDQDGNFPLPPKHSKQYEGLSVN